MEQPCKVVMKPSGDIYFRPYFSTVQGSKSILIFKRSNLTILPFKFSYVPLREKLEFKISNFSVEKLQLNPKY